MWAYRAGLPTEFERLQHLVKLANRRRRVGYYTPDIIENNFSRTKILSNAHGGPPLCVCPRVVTRVSNPTRSVNTSLMYSARMGWSELSCAPSATMTIVFRLPNSRCYQEMLCEDEGGESENSRDESQHTFPPPKVSL